MYLKVLKTGEWEIIKVIPRKDIKKKSTKELINDYKEITNLEKSYFKLLKKYDWDSTYESDPVLTAIQLELGRRHLHVSVVET